MPVILLERLPLPSLQTYTTFSVLLLSFAMFYANSVVSDRYEEREQNVTDLHDIYTSNDTNVTKQELDEIVLGQSKEELSYVAEFFKVLTEDTKCVWILINMAYCNMILFGKIIQKIAFGDLRVSEQQHLKDKFWNFVFYKFIFIFGVINVQNMEEVALWCAWFSVLGFLHLLAQLCKDRFEYLSFSPTTPMWVHTKVLLLLVAIGMACLSLLVACVFVGYMYTGINIFAFIAAEVMLLIVKTLYVMVRYAIHLWDLNHDSVWENRAIYVYYSELIFELMALSIDFAHHLHMLLWGNIFLSMASLVICMQLRYLFHEFQRRVRRHKNYLRVVNCMEAIFPLGTADELDGNNDDCAICWEHMDSARKLPCGHLFHNACLRSWLEQDTSCPTCRTSLSDLQQETERPRERPPAAGDAPVPPGIHAQPFNQTSNHFFHFDGSRYVSWFPSFSVEVTHTQLLADGHVQQAAHTSQLDNMARQVLEVFSTMPMNLVLEDLRQTRSVEQTIENIIEGRLTVPTNLNRSTPPPSNGSTATPDSDSGDHPDPPTEGAAADTDVPTEPAPPAQLEEEEEPLTRSPSSSSSLNFEASSPSTPSAEEPPQPKTENFASVSGGRFSKSSLEREAMLKRRKENMLEQARRRFCNQQVVSLDDGLHADPPPVPEVRHRVPTFSAPSSELSFAGDYDGADGSLDDHQRRRELAFQAAQRRLQQH